MKTLSLSIGEAAQRSGFPAATLRYYDELGLAQAERAANGYRRYAETDFERLRFIGRAKHLNCSLEVRGPEGAADILDARFGVAA
jgi:MerR family transcriptional regulator, copper efflux regulator